MIWFIISLIEISIILFLWYNITVYTYRKVGLHYCRDFGSGRRFQVRVLEILGLLLLFIPVLNLIIFLPYILYHRTRPLEFAYGDSKNEIEIYHFELKKYCPFLYRIKDWIIMILNKRVL